MGKSTNPPSFELNDQIYHRGSDRCFIVIKTPFQLIEDDVPFYQLRNKLYPHLTVKYPQDIVDREWLKEPTLDVNSLQKEIMINDKVESAFAKPFSLRDVIQHRATKRYYFVMQTPDTCIHNDVASYQLKQLGLGPKTPPFFRAAVDAELHWCATEIREGQAYNHIKMADAVDHLIRGDLLETQLFPEIGPYYFLGYENFNGLDDNHVCLFRRIVNGVAENEVRKFTQRDLLNNFRVHTLQTASIKPTPIKYEQSWMIKHLKSGEIYTIALLPNRIVIENTREPAYGFMMPDGRICIRSQAEVEDPKRFVRYIPPCNTVA